MFGIVVAPRVRSVWKQLERKNADPVMDMLAENFQHGSLGDHALGGQRRTREAQKAWFARVFRLFPDIRYNVREVLVRGWPWRMYVVAVVEVSMPSQPGYSNTVMQQLDLCWTRVTRILNVEDSQALAALLAGLGEAGDPEALAAPIEDGNSADAVAAYPAR